MEHFLISGSAGVGKTTLIRECVLPYQKVAGGFVTLEKRGLDGQRQGFEILRLTDGRRGLLASKDLASPIKVGKYGVDLNVLEELGVSAIDEARQNPALRLIVIDEIGLMEAESPNFRKLVLECLSDFQKPVLATIRAKSEPFTHEIQKLPNLKLVTLRRDIYATVKTDLQRWLQSVAR